MQTTEESSFPIVTRRVMIIDGELFYHNIQDSFGLEN
jgi:hypothetical protein